jgi:hypothetical protein
MSQQKASFGPKLYISLVRDNKDEPDINKVWPKEPVFSLPVSMNTETGRSAGAFWASAGAVTQYYDSSQNATSGRY